MHDETDSTEDVLTFDSVTIERGGQNILNGLNAVIGRSPITVVMGPNGAGKSVSLRAVAQLIPITSGRIRFTATPLPTVALVFQRPVLLRRSVRSNLLHALKLYGVPRHQRFKRTDELLSLGRLEALAERPARVLSGGEQQRVAMVRALAADPDFLLLDEPTASFDPQSTAAIEQLVRQAARAGTRVVLVTHDVGQAQRLADEVIFLHHGQCLEAQPADAFFNRPHSAQAKAYLNGELLV